MTNRSRLNVVIGSMLVITGCSSGVSLSTPESPNTAASSVQSTSTTTATPIATSTVLPLTVTATPSLTPSPTAMTQENPVVIMNTSQGTIKIELLADKAPKTAANFLKLTKEGFYDGVLFHRVIPGFMAQTGDPNSKDKDPYNDGTGGPGYKFEDEFGPGLSNARGMVAMANSGPNTNGSQFFINVVDNTFLDNGYSIFGKVIEGLDVVDKIVKVPTNKTDPRLKDRPVTDVRVTSITVQE